VACFDDFLRLRLFDVGLSWSASARCPWIGLLGELAGCGVALKVMQADVCSGVDQPFGNRCTDALRAPVRNARFTLSKFPLSHPLF